MLVLIIVRNMGSLILSLETILNDSLLKFHTITAINASGDTLNNSNLPAFLLQMLHNEFA